jgi:hypothetical protein
MDISSLLPLLLQRRGGNDDSTQSLLKAMNAMRGGGADGVFAQSVKSEKSANMPNFNDPASLLSLIPSLKNSKDPAGGIANILSTMQQSRQNQKKTSGLKPVRSFIPDEFMGKLVKFFSR